jgi:hypothetical protein
MPQLNSTGPEGKGPKTGRGLGRCKKASLPEESGFGKGLGKRRHSGGGQGEGKRLKSGLKNIKQ